ncbi:MAG: PAS domain S-box protein [Elainellaceae cyanobacterium]
MNIENDYLAKIKALEKANRVLQRKLERSHSDLIKLEESNEKKEFLLRTVIRDLNQTEQQLQSLVAGTATTTGKDFFPALVQHISETLHVTFAVVSEYVDGTLQTLACWAENELQPNLSYAPDKTPCGRVLQEGMFFCDRDVQQHFPEAAVVSAMGAESYLGVVLQNAAGQRIGNLCILDTKPIQNPKWAKQILAVFAARAAAELDRQRAAAALEQLNQELELKVAERTAALERREDRYRALVNVIPDLMVCLRVDGTYLDIIPADGDEVFNPETFDQGSNVYEAPTLEHAQQRLFYAQRALESGEVQVCECELECDGEKRFEENRIVAINDDEVLIMIRDITERKQVEERLRQVSTRLDLALKSADIGIWEWDIVHNHLIWDDRLYRLFGIPQEQFTNAYEAWSNCLHPDDRAQTEEILQQTCRNERDYDAEFRVVHPDGSIRVVKAYGLVQRDENGDAQRMIGINYDITDRKQSEARIKESEQRFRRAIADAPFPIMIHAEDGEVLQINGIWTELTGYTHQDLPTVQEWARRAYGDRANRILQDVIAKKYTLESRFDEGEFTVTTDNGFQRMWEFSSASLGHLPDGRKLAISMAVDVTQRRQTELALRESEERYRSIYEQASVGLVNATLDYKIVSVNPRLCELLGYSRTELLGKTVTEITHPEDRALIFPDHQRLLAGEISSFFQEKRYLRKDGRWFWAHTEVSMVRDIEGHAVHTLAVIQDITSRKRAEVANRQSQQFLRTVLNTFPLYIFWKDRQSVYLGCNENFARAVGLSSSEEIVGKTDYDLPWANTEASTFRIDDRQVMDTASAKLGVVETQIQADGSQQWKEINKIPLYSLDGDVIGVLGTYQDITSRKQAELQVNSFLNRTQLLNYISAEIRDSLDFEIILQSSVDAIFSGLAVSSCTFSWYRNTQTYELEIVKERKADVLPSAIATYHFDVFPSLFDHIETNRLYRVDCLDDLTDEGLRAFLQSIGLETFLCLPIHPVGGKIGSLQIGRILGEKSWENDEVELLRDIGNQMAIAIYQAQLYEESQSKTQALKQSYQELQAAQLQLVQSEKMSSLGQLVAGIAHEINNPVNFIYGNLSIASDYVKSLADVISVFQKTYPDMPLEVQKNISDNDIEYIISDFPKLMQSMGNGAKRIRNIIQSLRTFSRLDQADCKPVNIHESIDSTLVILQNRLNGRAGNPEIQVVKDYGNFPLVECYSGLLNQVFMNLLANAIDAIEEKQASLTQEHAGCITIKTEVVSANKVTISIKDNGVGMDQQVQDRIFNPFFTTKPIGVGTGMGLSISYQIVTGNHQGQLFCFSTPGEGTEFVIELWRSLTPAHGSNKLV